MPKIKQFKFHVKYYRASEYKRYLLAGGKMPRLYKTVVTADVDVDAFQMVTYSRIGNSRRLVHSVQRSGKPTTFYAIAIDSLGIEPSPGIGLPQDQGKLLEEAVGAFESDDIGVYAPNVEGTQTGNGEEEPTFEEGSEPETTIEDAAHDVAPEDGTVDVDDTSHDGEPEAEAVLPEDELPEDEPDEAEELDPELLKQQTLQEIEDAIARELALREALNTVYADALDEYKGVFEQANKTAAALNDSQDAFAYRDRAIEALTLNNSNLDGLLPSGDSMLARHDDLLAELRELQTRKDPAIRMVDELGRALFNVDYQITALQHLRSQVSGEPLGSVGTVAEIERRRQKAEEAVNQPWVAPDSNSTGAGEWQTIYVDDTTSGWFPWKIVCATWFVLSVALLVALFIYFPQVLANGWSGFAVSANVAVSLIGLIITALRSK